MINFISGLCIVLLVAYLFNKIKGYITNKAFTDLKKRYSGVVKLDTDKLIETQKETPNEFNCSIGKSYKTKDKEVFRWQKFKKIFDLGSPVEWIKSIKEIVDLRKLIIYCIVIGAIYGYAYFQGRLNAPVKLNLSYEKEWIMNINGEELYKPKYSNDVYIRDSKTKEVIKQIKAKDMGLLRKKLAPIGFILEPIFVAGGSVGDTNKEEVGAGFSFIKYWRWKLESFITSVPAIYIGTSYSITENSGIGVGIGKGESADNRVIGYYRWLF